MQFVLEQGRRKVHHHGVLDASARGAPEVRSPSPTSSSQALEPASNPAVWSHHGVAGTMIFCIKVCWQFCASSAYRMCRRHHPSAPDASFRDQSHREVHLAAARRKRLSERMYCCHGNWGPFGFTSFHQLQQHMTAEAHVNPPATG